MTMAVAAGCIAILALAAAFHFYWGLGGRTGSGVSLPHHEDGSVVIVKNSGAGAIVVGLALVAVALLVLALVDAFAVPMPVHGFVPARRCGRSYSSREQSAGPDMSACSSVFGTRASRDMIAGFTARFACSWVLGFSIWWRLPAHHRDGPPYLRPAARSRSHMAQRPHIRFRGRSGLECAVGFLYRAAFPAKPGQSPPEVRRKSQSCWVLK